MSDTYEAAVEIREAIRQVADELRQMRASMWRNTVALDEMRAELIALTEIVASARRLAP